MFVKVWLEEVSCISQYELVSCSGFDQGSFWQISKSNKNVYNVRDVNIHQ